MNAYVVALLGLLAVAPARSADQTQVGAGNDAAHAIAHRSPLVQSSIRYLVAQAGRIRDPALREATLDLLTNEKTCVMHRKGLGSAAAQDDVLQTLMEEGLVNRKDVQAFPSGARAAIFPPLREADSDCPQLPQSFESTPGSSFGGHHSYPGGLAVHEANNEYANVSLANQYQAVYGNLDAGGLLQIDAASRRAGDLPLDADVTIAAPLWHDWAKTLVFQWNADGSEFTEFYFGGAGTSDAWGAGGNSRTGGHHILGIAESMARGNAPLMVLTQASAHSAPTLGNEYKVVNWLRTAAIIARVDPVKRGYLALDGAGHLRLPALGGMGEVNLNAADQVNARLEYTLHTLSDADFPLSGPALVSITTVLKKLAPEFGYDGADVAAFNLRFRNPALAHLSAERLMALYADKGLAAVRKELQRLREAKVL